MSPRSQPLDPPRMQEGRCHAGPLGVAGGRAGVPSQGQLLQRDPERHPAPPPSKRPHERAEDDVVAVALQALQGGQRRWCSSRSCVYTSRSRGAAPSICSRFAVGLLHHPSRTCAGDSPGGRIGQPEATAGSCRLRYSHLPTYLARLAGVHEGAGLAWRTREIEMQCCPPPRAFRVAKPHPL